jgi:uncharacterized protein YndB with AHSA1/START domain
MPTVEHHGLIHRPPATVFAMIAAVERWPQWHPDAREARRTSSKPLGPGSAFRVMGQVRGRQVEATYQVTDFEPNRTLAITSVSGLMRVHARITLQEVDGSTWMIQTVEFHLGGLARLMEPLVARSTRRRLQAQFDNLTRLLADQHERYQA